MKKAAFYQIQDGDTGAQVAQGLKGIYQVYVLDADGSVEQEIVFECK